MKIGFIGYGKMAKAIGELALARGHETLYRLDSSEELEAQFEGLQRCDVLFEFTSSQAVVANLMRLAPLRIPVVCGTTGWNAKLAAVTAEYVKCNSTLFHAPNFSLGVNITLRLARQLAVYLNRIEGYTVAINETHHAEKLDAPSGTAIALAEPFIGEGAKYRNWGLVPEVASDALPITAYREDSVPGIHEILVRGQNDQILLKHEAFNRAGLAEGALAAALFVVGKKGIFSMDDLLV